MANLPLTAIIYHLVTLKALRVSVDIYRSKPVAAAWAVAALVLVVLYHLVSPLTFSKLLRPPRPSIPISTVNKLLISNCGSSGSGTPA